jgi:DUF4097 and DUF4098 domain-containing protein YvlB
MKKLPLIFATSIALLTTGCITVYANSLDYKESKQLSLDAIDINQLKIDATSGFLVVSGNNISQIEVTANIEAYNDNFNLSLKKQGNKAVLIADFNSSNSFSWDGDSPKIDLTIRIPMNIDLQIDDGSGSIKINKVASISHLDDGSGSIEISNVHGNVNIKDGSGSLSISDIKGNVDIDDGSGSITAKKITGYLKVEDGSGSMSITNVGGLVTIDDGSGSINVNHVQGGLKVLNQGSGGFTMNNIEGPVSID